MAGSRYLGNLEADLRNELFRKQLISVETSKLATFSNFNTDNLTSSNYEKICNNDKKHYSNSINCKIFTINGLLTENLRTVHLAIPIRGQVNNSCGDKAALFFLFLEPNEEALKMNRYIGIRYHILDKEEFMSLFPSSKFAKSLLFRMNDFL